MRKALLRASAIAAGCACLGTLVFFALSLLSLQTDNDRAREAVRAGFADGAIRIDGGWLDGNTDIGAHQWNDCLILYQAINREAPKAQLAVSPLLLPSGSTAPCANLHTIAMGQGSSAEPGYYHRYVHGQTVVARFLLQVISVRDIRRLYAALTSLVIIAGLAVAMLAATKPEKRRDGLFWLVAFLVVSRWFGLEAFGQSLGHAPSDLIIIGQMLIMVCGVLAGGLDPRGMPIIAAMFGTLTMIFELLTGGIPLGMALLMGGLPFAIAPSRAETSGKLVSVIIEALVAYIVAILTVILVKLTIVARLFGIGALRAMGAQLAYRMGIGPAPAAEIGQPSDVPDLLTSILGHLDAMVAGSRLLPFAMLYLSMIAGIWALRHALKYQAIRAKERAILLAASNLPLVLWTLSFRQHMAEHAFFMDRILVWTIVSGLALFVMVLFEDNRIAS